MSKTENQAVWTSQNERYFVVESRDRTERSLLVINGSTRLTDVLGCKVFTQYYGWFWNGIQDRLKAWNWRIRETDVTEYVKIAQTIDESERSWL